MIVPFIPFFGALYFYIKYLVDKNNLLFVYFEKYESGGHIRSSVKSYMFFNLFLYMFVIGSFFALKFSDDNFDWLGPIVIVMWIAFMVYFKSKIEPNQNWNELRKRLADLVSKDNNN